MDWALSLLHARLYAIYFSIRSRLVIARQVMAHISEERDDNDSFDLTTLERIPADVRAELREQDEVKQEPDQSDQLLDLHDKV